jgi:hypothetical protein
VCRKFALTHPHQFHNRLLLAFEDECSEWEMQAIPFFPDFDPPSRLRLFKNKEKN